MNFAVRVKYSAGVAVVTLIMVVLPVSYLFIPRRSFYRISGHNYRHLKIHIQQKDPHLSTLLY